MTDQMQLFAEYYLENGCKNAMQCAIKAGYAATTAKSKSYELLQRPDVAEYIAERKADIREQVQPERLLQLLAGIAYADITDVCEFEGPNFWLKDMNQIPPDKRKAILSVKQGQWGLEVKRINPLEAVDKIARMSGLYDDTLKLEGQLATGNPLEGMTTEQLQQLAAGLAAGLEKDANPDG